MTPDEMISWLDDHAVAYGNAGDIRNRQQAWAIRDAIVKQKSDGPTISVERLSRLLNGVRPKEGDWLSLDNNKGMALFKAKVANVTIDAVFHALSMLSREPIS